MATTNNSSNITMKRGIVGLVALGALAAAVAAGALLAGCQDGASTAGEASNERGRAVEQQQIDANGTPGGGDASDGQAEENGGGAVEPTSTPEPQPEPTEEPGDGGCQFCPEDVDDLAPVPTATPNDGCIFCPEDVDDLAPLPTPDDGCNFCPDDLDIYIPPFPTPTPDCNFCNDDLDLVNDWP